MSVPVPIFTDSPRQHPNFIIGALHVLAWVIFHPTAFLNHLQTLDPALEADSSWLFFLRNGRWRRGKNIRFFLQSQIVLPILAAMIVACGCLIIGVPSALVAFGLKLGVPFGVAVGVAIGADIAVAVGINVSVAVSMAFSMVFAGIANGGDTITLFLVGFVVAGIMAGGLGGLRVSEVNVLEKEAEEKEPKSFWIVVFLMGGILVSMLLGHINLEFGVGIEIPAIFVRVFFVVGVVISVLVCLWMYFTGALKDNVVGGLAVFAGSGLIISILSGMIFNMTFGVGYALHKLLPYIIYPFIQSLNGFLYHLDRILHNRQKIFLRWHSVGWYEWEHLPLTGLENHLVLALDINPTLGIEAINYVSTTRQRWAAQAAQIELDARSLARCQTIDTITHLPTNWGESSLSNPVTDILRIFSRIIRDVRAACDRQSKYNQRLALQEIVDRIDSELVGFRRSSDKYTIKFRPILEQWQKIINDYIAAQRQATELNQEIESAYIVGIPLSTNAKIFAGRQDLGSRLEQLILDTRRPPLLLYGQRRMGKTSLLNNLNRLLPSTIIPLFVDLQGNAAAANSLDGFLYALAKDLRTAASHREIALPPLQPNRLFSLTIGSTPSKQLSARIPPSLPLMNLKLSTPHSNANVSTPKMYLDCCAERSNIAPNLKS
jgi:MFS family permease